MSSPYDRDGYGMDDFNIEEYTRQVDFDSDDTTPPSTGGVGGDTGEYMPAGSVRQPHVRKHTRKKVPLGMRILKKLLIFLIYLLVLVIVSYFLANAGWSWANDLLALNKDELTVDVTLTDEMFTETEQTDEEGNTETVLLADLDAVASELKESGLIEYKWLFKLFASFTGKDDDIDPGTYELNTDMDYSALLRNMGSTSSARATVTVTIPEGYTVEQIIELLAENQVATEEELLDAATNYDFDYDFLDESTLGVENRLEGYLFPDTYEFYQNGDAATALNKLLYNFNSKLYDDELIDQTVLAQAIADGYTIADIITIASIIEKETDGVDQTSIASVIYNRLTNTSGPTNGYLQMDSTIQYILEERTEHLSSEDLAIDSPYNTYLYKGLPAGPICNPGITAIQAALNPDDTDYYYFVLGDDGSTHFFEDYDDFLAFRDAQTGESTDEEDTGDADEEG